MLAAACAGDGGEPTPTATDPAPTATSAAATATPTSPPPTATVPSVGTIDVRVTDQANGEITAIVITANDLRVNQAS